MSKSPVSLTVHRNTVEKRRKRALAADVAARTSGIIRRNDIRAYAFVAFDAQGKVFATFNTGAIMPMWAFPQTVGIALDRHMEDAGVAEDWRPSLTLKGGDE